MHEVLVNRLGGLSLPRKSVVRLTDRPDMTLDVYRGRKTTIQQTFTCKFLRYKLFYIPKYSTSIEYVIGQYYIILILATECRLEHALYNHLQEGITLLFSYVKYLDSRSLLLQIIVSLFWKKETFHRSYAQF